MDKREQILNAALKLFIEKGFQNTSTANISKEAGVATGTLFLYFAGKEVLINELYKACKTQFAEAMQKDFPQTGDMESKLRHLWFTANNWAYENSEAFRFIYMFKSSPLISNLTRDEINSSMEFSLAFFQEGIRKKQIAKIDMELLLAIIDGLLTATVNYIAANPAKSRKPIIERSFQMFWQGAKVE